MVSARDPAPPAGVGSPRPVPQNEGERLQGIAERNTVVIAESTRRLLGNLFDLEDLGAKEVKGIAEPVRAWAALRPSLVESRFEALRAAKGHSTVAQLSRRVGARWAHHMQHRPPTPSHCHCAGQGFVSF
jgi:hypothetical protein